MITGFDAKRAVFNLTGLGNYSRTLVRALAEQFPEHQYFLYTPRFKDQPRLSFLESQANVSIKLPDSVPGRLHPNLWRVAGISGQLRRDGVNVFHGLSNELPIRIGQSGAAKVVTIHDVIFRRFPDLYRAHDRWIYERKTRHACRHADAIIAVSQQTKADICEFYGVAESRIQVIYQACDPSFGRLIDNVEKQRVRQLYGLPNEYLLYVGSIERRKNLLAAIKVLDMLRPRADLFLLAIGNGDEYKRRVEAEIVRLRLQDRVSLRSDIAFLDFPAVYQMAQALIYPSIFEGFGIPILEALWSRTPVITSRGSCFAEAGGPRSIYVDPHDYAEMAQAIETVITDSELREEMTQAGFSHAQNFRREALAAQMMGVYRRLVQ